MTQFKVLLIGLGQMGCGYDADLPFISDLPASSAQILSHARSVACHPGFELVAGIDPDHAACRRFETIYSKPAFLSLGSWHATSACTAIDLVILAVHPRLQPSLMDEVLALMAPKAVLLEKPIALDLDQASRIESRCAAFPSMIVAVNYIRRYLQPVRNWHDRLSTHHFGRLLHGSITYGKGLLSNGSHFVNLAEFWLGPLAFKRMLDLGPVCQGYDREASIELSALKHDYASLYVHSIGSSGMRAGELDLWFERGRLSWLNDGQSILSWARTGHRLNDDYESLEHRPHAEHTGMRRYQHDVMDSLHHALLLDNPALIPCRLEDAVATLHSIAWPFM